MKIYQFATMLYNFISIRGNSSVSKSFFVVEAAGLEPAWSQEVGAKTEAQNVKQHHSLARTFPATIYGAMLPLWAEAAVRPIVLKPKPMHARFTPGYMILTKIIA